MDFCPLDPDLGSQIVILLELNIIKVCLGFEEKVPSVRDPDPNHLKQGQRSNYKDGTERGHGEGSSGFSEMAGSLEIIRLQFIHFYIFVFSIKFALVIKDRFGRSFFGLPWRISLFLR